MPRVTHVKAARKAIPHAGIEVGQSYYWWAFRFGGKRYSKTYPEPQQLTQSEYQIALYDISDDIAGLSADSSLPDDVADIAERYRELAQECQDKLDNMPEGLQQGATGELLQERIDACESAADEFENIDFSDAPEDKDEDDDKTDADKASTEDNANDDEVNDEIDPEQYWQDKLDEVNQCCTP